MIIRSLLAAAVTLIAGQLNRGFAAEYLVQIENIGYRDVVVTKVQPIAKVLTSVQFVVEPEKPFRSRFTCDGKLVTFKGTLKPELDGLLHLAFEYSEQFSVGDVVVGPDGLSIPRVDKNLARSSMRVKLGQRVNAGGMNSSQESRVADNTVISTRSKTNFVLRITQFNPDELTPEEVEESDQNELLGIWNVTELVSNGQKASDETVQQMDFRFEHGRLSIRGLDSKLKTRRYEFQLDANENPRRMEMIPLEGAWQGESIPAIYELNGPVMRIAIPDLEATDRPMQSEQANPYISNLDPHAKYRPLKLESAAGSTVRVITLKRTLGFQRSG